MNNSTKPVLLNVYESGECQGVISPYMVKDSLFNIVDMILERHENLYKVFESIPNTKFAHGSADCVSMHPAEWETIGPSTQQPNNMNTERYPQNTNKCNVLDSHSKVLPPHKMSYTCTGNPTFESNIYRPCIIPLEQSGSKTSSNGTYNTGNYPGDVNSYPSMNQISEEESSCNCSCCDQPDYTKLSGNRDVLQHELFLWLRGIRDIQIINLISSLVEANKIPIDADFMYWMRRVLSLLLDTKLYRYVRKFGVMMYTQRTISAPHIRKQRQLFIQVDVSDDTRDCIVRELTERLTAIPRSLSVMILTDKEYEFHRQHYPIDVCFDCAVSHHPSTDITMMDMVLVNDNQFIPKIYMKFKTDDIVKVMAPADCMHVSAGTSGRVMFQIGENDPNTWSVDQVIINNHKYSLEELLRAHLPDTTGHPGIREYEYASLSAECTQIEALPYSYTTLTLFYTNVTSDINVSIDTIRILPKSEFNIDVEHIQSRVSTLLNVNLTLFSDPTQYTLGKVALSEENDTNISGSEGDTGSTDAQPIQKGQLSVALTVPFIGIYKNQRDSSLLKIRRIVRDPNTLEVVKEISCPDALIGLSGMTLQQDLAYRESQLAYDKQLTITNCQCDENAEFAVTLGQGALWVASAKYRQSYVEKATNQDIVLRFAVNAETKEVEILGDDELPGYLTEYDKPLELEVTHAISKPYFIEGKIVTKEELIALGLEVCATGGSFKDTVVPVTDDITISEKPLHQVTPEDKIDTIDIYYTSEQGEQAVSHLVVFVYSKDDDEAMYANCTALYSFDNADPDKLFEDSISCRMAKIVPYESGDPNDNLDTILRIYDGMIGGAISFSQKYGAGLEIDAPIGQGDFTISMRIRYSDQSTNDVRLFKITDRAGCDRITCNISSLGISLGENLSAAHFNQFGRYEIPEISTGQWLLITFVLKDGYCTVYNDNKEIPLQSDSKNNTASAQLSTINLFTGDGAKLTIGATGFVGDVDELLIFDTALTVEQVNMLCSC